MLKSVVLLFAILLSAQAQTDTDNVTDSSALISVEDDTNSTTLAPEVDDEDPMTDFVVYECSNATDPSCNSTSEYGNALLGGSNNTVADIDNLEDGIENAIDVNGNIFVHTVGEVNERAVECPDDPNQIGYKHIIDINVDQRTELDNIQRGAAPRKPYVFPLCNSFKFNMDEEILQVLLDEMLFVCGYNGENGEDCILEGGDLQVNIPPGQETNVEFKGITFANFTAISTQAYGSGKIIFTDARWWNFLGAEKAVHQMNPEGGEPMQVIVNKGLFDYGEGRHLLDNVGGSLTVHNLTVVNGVKAYAVMATSNAGSMSLTMADVSTSDIVVSQNSASLVAVFVLLLCFWYFFVHVHP